MVDKILAKVQLWQTRTFSFVGRARLIGSVLFGMFNYWASIFLLPKEVLESLTSISRAYLWGGGWAQRIVKESLTSHGSIHAYPNHKGGWA